MSKPQTIDEYLAPLPTTQREALQNLRETIQAAAPEATEAISSGVPAFRYRDRYLVSFRATKSYLSFFVMRGTALKQLASELKKSYDVSNTVIRFKPDAALPAPLIEKIVKMRVEEINASKGG